MKQIITFAVFLAINSYCLAQEAEISELLAQEEQPIQEQIKQVYEALNKQPGLDPTSNVVALQEIQNLKNIVADKFEIVKQVAIFAAKPGEGQPLYARAILDLLDLPPKIVIRTLAPYLNADNKNLRSFVQDWFQSHDNAGSDFSALEQVKFEDYLDYVRGQKNLNREAPNAFTEYIYERHPGKALLVFAYASSQGDVTERLQAIHEALRANREGRAETPEKMQEQREETRKEKTRRLVAKNEKGEILLAEHLISNAIWLNKNGFGERFQNILPEAKQELAKLAEHDQWWARLYVAEIMRRYPELRLPDVFEKLKGDSNELVSKATKGALDKAAALPPVAPNGAVPLVAPREVEARAVGEGKIRVDWQPSVGATSYDVLRRRPDTETEFTTIATDVKETTYTDSTDTPGILYQYRVVAKAPDGAQHEAAAAGGP